MPDLETLAQLAARGVTLRLSAHGYNVAQLNLLAAQAAAASGQFHIMQAAVLSPEHAQPLANLLGKGLVVQL